MNKDHLLSGWKSVLAFLTPSEKTRGGRILFFSLAVFIPSLVILFILIWPFIYPESFAGTQKLPTGEQEKKSSLQSAEEIQSTPRVISETRLVEQYWKNRLELAKSDSIYLSIDLTDSVIMLEIKGVMLRSARIQNFNASRWIQYFRDRNLLAGWIQKPFTVTEESATIPKAPIRLVEAPRDTSEAQELLNMGIPEPDHNIRFRLECDRNLIVQINQAEAATVGGHFRFFVFEFNRNLSHISSGILGLAGIKSLYPHMYISMEIPQADARAIYRALPPGAQIVLKL